MHPNHSRAASVLTALTAALALTWAPAGAVPSPASGAPAAPSEDEEVDTDYGRMMLVLDSSGSMKEKAAGGQTKIAAAKQALNDVIDNLPDDADVGLQVFGATVFSRHDKGACTDTQVVVDPGTDNRDELTDAVQQYKPYGETPIPAALKKAARSLGSEGRRSIVLVSDGESTCGNPCDVAADIGKSGIDVQIDVVGLDVSGTAKQQLQCVASKGNGTYYDADDAEDLAKNLKRISDRAVQPFVVQGKPVTGTASPSNAPEITTGVWRDQLPGEGKEVHYKVKRTIPGSTLWVGLVAQPGKSQQQAQLRLSSPDDKDCGKESDYNSILGTSNLHLLGVALNSADDEWCTDADELDLGIAMTEWSDGDADAPMQVTVYEEPPLADDTGLQPGIGYSDPLRWRQQDHSGTPDQVTPGNSLASAPLLEPGTYDTGGIVPGDVQIFKVHLDWGETLQARGVIPVHTDAYDAYGIQAPVVRISVLSPLGGPVESGHAVDAYDDRLTDYAFPPTSVSQDVGRIHAKTAPVRYLNRTESHMANLALPGDYYVVLTQQRDAGDDSVIMPMTLEIDTFAAGDPEDPSFADDAEVTGPTTGDPADEDASDNGTEEGTDRSDAAEDGDTLRLVAGSTAVGLGIIALLGAVLLLLRRRRT